MTAPAAPAPAPSPLALALTIPSTYTNHIQLSCINLMFRLTFMEHSVLDAHTSTPTEVIVPRVAVTLTRECAGELHRMLGAFLAQVDETFLLAREGGPLQ